MGYGGCKDGGAILAFFIFIYLCSGGKTGEVLDLKLRDPGFKSQFRHLKKLARFHELSTIVRY